MRALGARRTQAGKGLAIELRKIARHLRGGCSGELGKSVGDDIVAQGALEIIDRQEERVSGRAWTAYWTTSVLPKMWSRAAIWGFERSFIKFEHENPGLQSGDEVKIS